MATYRKAINIKTVTTDIVSGLWNKRTGRPNKYGVISITLIVICLLHFAHRISTSGSDKNPKFENLEEEILLEDDDGTQFEKIVSNFSNPLPVDGKGKVNSKRQHHLQVFGKPEPKRFPVEVLAEPRTLKMGCSDELLLLVVLNSEAHRVSRRKAIRMTWGVQTKKYYPKLEKIKWKTVFVMGRYEHHQDIVKEESATHGDILQGAFTEQPHEDTRKFLLALKWINEGLSSKCRPVFILQSQDNIYHNMAMIVKWLEFKFKDHHKKDLFTGKLLRFDKPIRNENDIQYVSKTDYKEEFFPDMIQSPVYLFTLVTYKKIWKAMSSQVPITMTDAYIGILARNAGVSPKHNDHFQMLSNTYDVCHYLSIFFVYDVTASDQVSIFSQVKGDKKSKCDNSHLVDGRRGVARNIEA